MKQGSLTKPAAIPWGLAVSGVLLWLVAVLPAYYVVHKPFMGESALVSPTISFNVSAMALAIGSRLAALGLLAATVVMVAAWGSRLGRWLGMPFESDLERWALGATLGLGLLGSVVFGLGAVGGLYPAVAYLLLGILGVAGGREVRTLVRGLRPRLHPMPGKRIPWLWLYAGLVGLLSLGTALLPPTAWDALVYHLQGPRLYVEAHRLIAVPENFYLNWPAQVEMLFTWGLLLQGELLAQLLHWVFWPLTAILLYALVRRNGNPEVGGWAVALWASVPFAGELAGVAYVDVGLTAFVLGGVYGFLRWTESQDARWLTLAALFLGLAMATKYTAVTWLGLLVLLVVHHGARHQKRPTGWLVSQATKMGMIAALPVLPWLVKNWIVTGNPVYPFLLGGVGWNETRAAWLVWPGHGYSRNLLDYLALPWIMTVTGVSRTAAFDATTGPLLLCLAPLVVLFRGLPKAVRYVLILLGGQWVLFALLIGRYVYLAQTRLLLPVFPLLCLVAAFVLEHLSLWDRAGLHLSQVVRGIVVVVLMLTLATEAWAFLGSRPLPALFGLEPRQNYLARRLGAFWDAMSYVNEQLPDDVQLFFLWEPRGYYCDRAAQADVTLDNLAQLRVAYGSADKAVAALQAGGVTHVLVHRAGLEFLQQPTPCPPRLSSLVGPSPAFQSYYPISGADLAFLHELLDRCWKVKQTAGIYEIYQLPQYIYSGTESLLAKWDPSDKLVIGSLSSPFGE